MRLIIAVLALLSPWQASADEVFGHKCSGGGAGLPSVRCVSMRAAVTPANDGIDIGIYPFDTTSEITLIVIATTTTRILSRCTKDMWVGRSPSCGALYKKSDMRAVDDNPLLVTVTNAKGVKFVYPTRLSRP